MNDVTSYYIILITGAWMGFIAAVWGKDDWFNVTLKTLAATSSLAVVYIIYHNMITPLTTGAFIVMTLVTIFNSFLFLIWRTNGWHNVTMKIIFGTLSAFNILIILNTKL